MSSDNSDIVNKLGEIASEGYVIIDDHNLHNIWDHIPTSGESDWQEGSFDEYLHQTYHSGVYKKWQEKLKSVFDENNLDFLKFKHKTTFGDARRISQYPAAQFMRTMRELDKIIHNSNSFNEYKAFTKRPSSWPEIFYQDGVIKQGVKSHKFTVQEYVELLDLIWDGRRIVSPSGVLMVKEQPQSRDSIFEGTSIKNLDRLKDIMTGVRKAMKSKDKEITMGVYSPTSNSVFVEVCQK